MPALLAVMTITACELPPSGGRAPTTDATQATPSTVTPWFGGYLDITLVPAHRLADSPPHGSVTIIMSFIVSNPARPCEPSWDGFYDMEQANVKLDLDRQVERFRQAGNDIAVSFGGELGKELATACTDGDALARAYASVITKYGLDVMDLDVEGTGLADQAAAKRRATAIARLQAERDPATPLKVWLTLPVSTDGLTPEGEFAVATMLESGVDLTGVNIMTMNFGPLGPGQTMLDASICAANGTHRALTALYEKADKPIDGAALWKKIGLTPHDRYQ